MTNARVGDVVVCVDPDQLYNAQILIGGEVYEVLATMCRSRKRYVQVAGRLGPVTYFKRSDQILWWSQERFMLVGNIR